MRKAGPGSPPPKAGHFLTHKAYNKLWHIAHGNGSRIVTKIYTDGQPMLAKDKLDPEAYIMGNIDFTAWVTQLRIHEYVIGPEPLSTTTEQREQALRYLTSAVEDKDLRAATAQAVDNAPDALRWLETEYLQGVEKMPAFGRLLETMSLWPSENVITFK